MLEGRRTLTVNTSEGGFTILEGMLAAAILAIGLLALAGMQGISLGRNVDANELTVATNLAADMIERIQFNRRNVSDYKNINTSLGTAPPSSSTMASGDYAQWLARLQGSRLKNAQGVVSVLSTGPTSPPLNENIVTVQVTWQGTASGGGILSRNRNVSLVGIIAPE